MDWLRWYTGTVTDPKWRLVAVESGQPVAVVLAVWAMMLERAGRDGEGRGTITGWNDRVAGAAIDVKGDAVGAVRAAMQGLTLDGDRLTGWESRQPRREREDHSTDRVRRFRERKREERRETPCNAGERPEESRGEESTETPPSGEIHAPTREARQLRRCPKSFHATDEHRTLAAELGADMDRELAKFRDHTFRTPRSDWDATFRNWLRDARSTNGTRGSPSRNGTNGRHGPDEEREFILTPDQVMPDG